MSFLGPQALKGSYEIRPLIIRSYKKGRGTVPPLVIERSLPFAPFRKMRFTRAHRSFASLHLLNFLYLLLLCYTVCSLEFNPQILTGFR